MPYITKKQLAELRRIAATATMNDASFGFPTERVTGAFDTHGKPVSVTPDEYIKARTRIWRQSWIVGPLNEICNAIENRGVS